MADVSADVQLELIPAAQSAVGAPFDGQLYFLKRLLPEPHPFFSKLVLDSVELIRGLGFATVVNPTPNIRNSSRLAFGSNCRNYLDNDPASFVPFQNADIQPLPNLPAAVSSQVNPRTGQEVESLSQPGFRMPGGQTDTPLDQSDGAAEVRLTWRSMPFSGNWNVADAATRASASGELLRWTSRLPQPAVENTIVGGAWFKVILQPGDAGFGGVAPNVGNEGPARALPTQVVKMTWHMVPFLPPSAFFSVAEVQPILATVNKTGFDGDSGGGYRPVIANVPLLDQRYPPGTLLFLHAEASEPYWTFSGTMVWDITYTFVYRPTGWHKIYRQSVRDFREITSTGVAAALPAQDGVHPYNYREFLDLFRFRFRNPPNP